MVRLSTVLLRPVVLVQVSASAPSMYSLWLYGIVIEPSQVIAR